MTRKPEEPELIVIYVPDGLECHMCGAGRKSGEWKWSNWTVMPVSELDAFLSWCLERGMTVIDNRLLANLKKQGMGNATPIVIAHDIPIQLAVKQAVSFHKLLVKVSNEKQP
jgi:hypothetical protein